MNSLYGNVSYGDQYFNNYGNNRYLNASREFLNTNSIIAKLAFLILVIFLFIIILRLGIIVLSYIFTFSKNPILIDGVIDGQNMIIRKQNPQSNGAIPVLRSTDQMDGLEFTWSTWLYIKNPPLAFSNANTNQYHHVFNKGNDNIDEKGIVSPNNCPGVYLSPNYRELLIVMNTFENIREDIVISDLPIEKWMNIIIRVNQRQLDVFINGTMTRSKTLNSIPRQNYDNVNIALNGGFAGNLSSLRYFSRAIGTNKIQNIIAEGPNLTPIGTELVDAKPYYLSFRWFYPQQITI